MILSALTASAWSALLGGLVLVAFAVAVWLVSGGAGPSVGDAARFGALGWVASHQAPLTLAGGVTFTLVPLGLLAVPVIVTARASRWAFQTTTPRSTGAIAVVSLTFIAGYAVLAALAASLLSVGGASVSATAAGVSAAAVAAFGTAIALVRRAYLDRAALPAWLTPGCRAAGRVVGLLLALGAAGLAFSTVLHLGEIVATGQSLAVTPGGTIGLGLVQAIWIPDAVLWSLSYLSGASLSVGAGLSVSVFGGVDPGLVPLPVLAALPAVAPWWAPFLLMLPVGLGALGAGRLVSLRARDRLIAVALAALIVGVVIGTLAGLSGGGIGTGRWAHLGPTALPVGLLAGSLTGLGLLLSAFADALVAGINTWARTLRGAFTPDSPSESPPTGA